MWYYVKRDKTKVGPISDPALVSLFKKGEVKSSTLVWSQNQNKWTEFKNTKFFKKITKPQKNYKFEAYKYKTYLLRSLIWSLIIMFAVKAMLVYDVVQSKFVMEGASNATLQQLITFREAKAVVDIFSILQSVVVIMTFVMAATWISSTIKASKAVSSRILMSSRLSFLGCLAPIANIILNPSIVKRIFYYLLISFKNPLNAISVIYFRTWIFVWFISWIAVSVSKFVITTSLYPEITESIGWMKIYNCGVITVMLFGSALVVQKIFKMLKSKYE